MINGLEDILSPAAKQAFADEQVRIEDELSRLVEERRLAEASLRRIDERAELCRRALHFIRGLDSSDHTKSAAFNAISEHVGGSESAIEIATQILGEAGNLGLHYRALADAVAKRGVQIGGKDPAATFLSLITNAKYIGQFERVGRGIYRLVSPNDDAHERPTRHTRRRRRAKRRAA